MIVTELEMMGVKMPKNIFGISYGVAYRLVSRRALVIYPIPFNFVVGWLHRLADRLKYTNQGKYEKALCEARHAGVIEGKEIVSLQWDTADADAP